MTTSQRRSTRRGGVTLIEVMLVLVILVVLASLAVTAYGPIQRRALSNAAKAMIGELENALELYRLDVQNYPTTADGLEALRSAPSSLSNSDKWHGAYLRKPVPNDPWDAPYQYEYPGKHNVDAPDIWSLGPDGIGGTDDDVTNWSEE